MRAQKVRHKDLNDQRDVVQTPRAPVLSARGPVQVLHFLDHVLSDSLQVWRFGDFLRNQVREVLVDSVRPSGPGLVRLVQPVRHQDQEPVEVGEVDRPVQVRVCYSWLTCGVPVKLLCINFQLP